MNLKLTGLLFFNDQPECFFPYIHIDVVYFPDDESGDIIQEEIFKGPLDHQLRSALRHIKNNFISERMVKIPGQAEANRFFNYPFEAIEEALVNAVYHRSYEIREPIEVRINRECIRVVSHPGPDPSITLDSMKTGHIMSRRYRNRRLGEFLKELEFTEGRGTGIPKMRLVMKANGSPEPTFFTDETRQTFWTEIKIHPEFLKDHRLPKRQTEVYDQVYDSEHVNLSETETRILQLVTRNPINLKDILSTFGYQALTGNIRVALNNLLKRRLLTYTIPDKPRSKRQQYRITQQGIEILKSFESMEHI